jgi:hypothetical protein
VLAFLSCSIAFILLSLVCAKATLVPNI